MKKIEDKTEEKWLDSLMKDTSLDMPSSDFTSKVMLQVQASKKESATAYKPLLSKSVLIAILICFAGLFIFLLNNEGIASKNRFQFLDFSLGYSTAFEFSQITMYAVLFSTIFLLIQISWLHKYFRKQSSQHYSSWKKY
jgi:hypothetical protein